MPLRLTVAVEELSSWYIKGHPGRRNVCFNPPHSGPSQPPPAPPSTKKQQQHKVAQKAADDSCCPNVIAAQKADGSFSTQAAWTEDSSSKSRSILKFPKSCPKSSSSSLPSPKSKVKYSWCLRWQQKVKAAQKSCRFLSSTSKHNN